ncbi:MAG: DUF2461 domain-containing protein [Gemmatimonadaceae bacterium]|nr:DUF2461 domain-containing protein [Gemmatimonadaceae bacterium]
MPPRRSATPPADFAGFPPDALRFLRDLAAHNDRTWFEANRPRYEQHLREPMAALVDEMDARLAGFAPEIIGTRKQSMFRIHRDVRFSKDKSPYKTNAACWFFHRDSRGTGQEAVHGGAGFYYQLQPRNCFAGGGVWMPPMPGLKRIRAALTVGHEEFASIVTARRFTARFGALDAEAMLVRTPRGVAPDHPAAPWLRYQSFTAGCQLTHPEATAATLPATLETIFRELLPFVRWLNGALGFAPATRR